jgi:predicted PurR-regulated permease PerM
VPGPSSNRIVYLVVSAALVLLGIWILWEFLAALIWATVLAIATWPLFKRFTLLLPGRPALASLIFTLVMGLVFLVPLGFIAVELGTEAVAAARTIPSIDETGLPVPAWLDGVPLVGHYASQWWQANLADPHAATALLGRLDRNDVIEWVRTIGTQLARRSTELGFTLLTLFFLYRDGATLVHEVEGLVMRHVGPSGRQVGLQMIMAVRGAVNGLVLVGLAEGVLLGVGYALASLPHAVLLGALTGIFAMIPFGAPIILLVASFMLVAQSGIVAGIVLFVVGSVVMAIADHFVRPALIGGAVALPFLWVLLGILGGVQSFGLLGLFLGPAVMAALVALWRQWVDAPTVAVD